MLCFSYIPLLPRCLAASQRCPDLYTYKEGFGHETERYHSFNSLASPRRHRVGQKVLLRSRTNRFLSQLERPVSVEDSFSKRISEYEAVLLSAMACGERSKDGPKINHFHWYELLAFKCSWQFPIPRHPHFITEKN